MLDAANIAVQVDPANEPATAIAAIFDPKSRMLQFCSAGHPMPILCIDGEIHPPALRPRPALGLRVPPERATETVQLTPGSIVVLYTDGLTESTHDTQAGEALLWHAVLDEHVLREKNPAEALLAAVVDGRPPDDVAILILRIPKAQ
jgi:serine phosphatase RsbU (regulator of sigma subunit)